MANGFLRNSEEKEKLREGLGLITWMTENCGAVNRN
jgi:hypothetical protein